MARVNILALILKHHKFKLVFLFLSLVVLFNTLLYTHVFTVFDVITQNNIVSHLVTERNQNNSSVSCILRTYNAVNLLYPDTHVPDDLEAWAEKQNITKGEWKPYNCVPLFFVAIIIPYRAREQHLKIFMFNIHPFLQQQNIHYKIYVIEQSDIKDFNRGKLFNIGFVEALKDHHFPCFIFHDIDLLPQNLNNIYACTQTPRHMSSSLDKFRYVVPYDRNFGGVVAMLEEQFQRVNGFSNNFYGWGGEDDDFFNRVADAGFQVSRFSPEISRYASLHHTAAQPSDDRFDKLAKGMHFQSKDGLNTLTYALKDKTYYSSHVRVSIST